MVLNYIWIGFFLISLVIGFIRLVFFHDTEIFTAMVNSTFEMAAVAVEICLGLIGVLTLWLGLMKVGERGGAVAILARVVGHFFQKPLHRLNRYVVTRHISTLLEFIAINNILQIIRINANVTH